MGSWDIFVQKWRGHDAKGGSTDTDSHRHHPDPQMAEATLTQPQPVWDANPSRVHQCPELVQFISWPKVGAWDHHLCGRLTCGHMNAFVPETLQCDKQSCGQQIVFFTQGIAETKAQQWSAKVY